MKLRDLFEAPSRTAAIAFGRMNPPTIGHAKLVDTIKSQAGDPFVFLSQGQKPKTDPLVFADKLRYAKFFFPEVTIGNPEVKTIIQALQKIESMGYDNLIYVAGSDRVASFEELINKYNGKDYNFNSISVVSAGERDPDADGAEGMSASKMRAAAAENDLESFKQGVPRQEVADEMFAAVRKGMGVMDAVPAESIGSDINFPGFDNDEKKKKKKKKDKSWLAKAKELVGLDEAGTKPGQGLPKQIKVLKMPTPPQAPTGPDGTDENGTRIGTTPKGNRSVKSGAGTYIFTPKGKLMLYMTPKISGLQQTHNPIKQTVTVNFTGQGSGASIDQKATYDMSGKLISRDTTSISSGDMGISTDKDKGTTMDLTTLSGTKHSLNSKDPKKYDKLAAMKKDMDQSRAAFKKDGDATLAKMGIKR